MRGMTILETTADFGDGQRLGYHGAMDMGSFLPLNPNSDDPLIQAQYEAQLANAQVSNLQAQIDALQTQESSASANIAYSLQSQIADLQAQLSAQRAKADAANSSVAAKTPLAVTLRNALPYLAVGTVVLAFGIFALKKSR